MKLKLCVILKGYIWEIYGKTCVAVYPSTLGPLPEVWERLPLLVYHHYVWLVSHHLFVHLYLAVPQDLYVRM